MMHHKLLSAGISAALCLSLIPVAMAATTSDEVIAKQKAFKAVEMCEDKQGTFRGKCITDVIKRIAMLRDELKDALEIERTEWYKAHASLGVSEDYTKALNEYTKGVTAKRKLFNDQQRELEKIFFAKQKELLSSSKSSSSSSSSRARPVTKTDLTSAEEKCAKIKDTTAKRLCMRQQLRFIDPAARKMGAGVRSSRSQ